MSGSRNGNRPPAGRRNGIVVGSLVAVVVAMVGLSFAAVPLYRMFCEATGYDGTTQRAAAAPGGAAGEPLITVRFNADTAGDLGWEFRPLQREVKVRPGEQTLIAYHAENKSGRDTVAAATFNVTPLKAGAYFDKIQCFCFDEQHLAAGASVDMPVSFFVDPSILTDPNTKDVRTITLSYTMFRAKSEPRPVADAARPPAAIN
ncbi:MAG TPA: cytochrome c oxidase assembly protein [Stellaceae bacterium]|jgi:cytochrome c oxidase assembly protein subunit 11